MAAYEAHNAAVRDAIPASRLVEWRPGDGWGPLCAALDVAVPEEPFPHVNTTEEFRADAARARRRRVGRRQYSCSRYRVTISACDSDRPEPIWSRSIAPIVGSSARSICASGSHSCERMSAFAQCR